MKTDSMIDNLVNGNLEDARKQAKRYGWVTIYRALRERGDSDAKACAGANYMKGSGTFQNYCDAK